MRGVMTATWDVQVYGRQDKEVAISWHSQKRIC